LPIEFGGRVYWSTNGGEAGAVESLIMLPPLGYTAIQPSPYTELNEKSVNSRAPVGSFGHEAASQKLAVSNEPAIKITMPKTSLLEISIATSKPVLLILGTSLSPFLAILVPEFTALASGHSRVANKRLEAKLRYSCAKIAATDLSELRHGAKTASCMV
jgi:hypothetical protein